MNLEPLSRLADLVAEPGELTEVYSAAARAVTQMLGADRAAILVAGDDGITELAASHGLSSEYRRLAASHWAWAPAATVPAVVVAADLSADGARGGMRDAMLAEGICAAAFVPLIGRAGLIGALAAYFDAPRHLTAADMRVAEHLAHHVALALDRARARPGRAVATDVLSVLGHALRNPLNAIVSAAQVIETPTTSEPLRALAHGILRREVVFMGRLLDHLLDETRLRRGLVALRREPFDLRAAVRLAVEELARQSGAKGQELSVVMPDDPIVVTGDTDRLRQVVSHLVDNAIRLTPAHGSIRLELSADAEAATIQVRDTGVGIPPDRLAAIFEPFGGSAHDPARRGRGLGLGLSLVKRIVELHGGSVRAESDGLDKGAEFVARIPLARLDAPGPPARRAD